MITLELFKETLQAIKDTGDKNRKFSKAMEEVSDSWFISELANPVTDALLNVLTDIFKDDGKWIDYCIYEKDWFTKDMEATYKDGTVIPLSTVEELYDFLIANMENK